MISVPAQQIVPISVSSARPPSQPPQKKPLPGRTISIPAQQVVPVSVSSARPPQVPQKKPPPGRTISIPAQKVLPVPVPSSSASRSSSSNQSNFQASSSSKSVFKPSPALSELSQSASDVLASEVASEPATLRSDSNLPRDSRQARIETARMENPSVPFTEKCDGSRSITVINRSSSVLWARIFATDQKLLCLSSCASNPLPLSDIYYVGPNPRGTRVPTRICYDASLDQLSPTTAVRLFWNRKPDALDETTLDPNSKNERISLGLSTFDIS